MTCATCTGDDARRDIQHVNVEHVSAPGQTADARPPPPGMRPRVDVATRERGRGRRGAPRGPGGRAVGPARRFHRFGAAVPPELPGAWRQPLRGDAAAARRTRSSAAWLRIFNRASQLFTLREC